MAHSQLTSQSLLRCLRQSYRAGFPAAQLQSTRSLSTTTTNAAAAQEQQPSDAATEASKQAFYKNPDPNLVVSPRLERRLVRAGTPPIGSRRRRAALQSSDQIPFEQLPYQCFQEARKVIVQDRAEKLKKIGEERARLERLLATPAEQLGGENGKYTKVYGLRRQIELLKIQADINDPIVKRKFEDGEAGDMSRPIYRFLADRKWREYRRLVLEQRITQMNVVPDVLASIDPIVDVKLFFKKAVQPGDFVNSAVSVMPPKLDIQAFTGDPKLVTIAVVDSDVPVMETDSFTSRCHFLAVNVPLSPTSPKVNLASLAADSQVILPWFPPHAHKGTPYHRLTTVVLEQRQASPLDLEKVAAKVRREEFSVRALQSRHNLKAIGVHMFRNEWDEQTPDVMKQHNIEGADIEFKRRKPESLPYKRRDTRRMRG
ncbi:54S ribosomal protein, mitochondrial [Ascosphaera pollenicola]|nr:54S ribosomal protein, mitochondrial [Ascosphaera pollenicola]